MLCACFKYESGLKKSDMHIQKSPEALADASKSIRQRIEKEQ